MARKARWKFLLFEKVGRVHPGRAERVGFNPAYLQGIGREAEALGGICEDVLDREEFMADPAAWIARSGAQGVIFRLGSEEGGRRTVWNEVARRHACLHLGFDPTWWGGRQEKGFENVVVPDEGMGYRLLVDHLRSVGCGTFRFVSHQDFPYAFSRFDHLRRALEEAGVGRPSVIRLDGNAPPDLETARKGLPPGGALICETDRLAEALFVSARKNGSEPFASVRLCGFDDAPLRLPPHGSNPFTTLRQDLVETGRLAVRMLHEIVRGERPSSGQRIEVPVRLIVRESSLGGMEGEEENARREFDRRFEDLLERWHGEEDASFRVAKGLGLSKEYFLLKVRRMTGTKFPVALSTFRAKRALFLLRSTALPVVDVQVECGFRTHQSLTRALRALTGRTATELRESGQ